MSGVVGTIAKGTVRAGQGLTSWVHGLVARGYADLRTQRQNEAARGLVGMGEVSASNLVAGRGRSIVLGAPDQVADKAVAGLVASSLAQGVPAVVLSEGAGNLASELAALGWPGAEVLDAARPAYEPLACLSEAEAVDVAARALALVPGAPQETASYLGGIARVISLMGGPVMVRSIDNFPHNRAHEVVARLELGGSVDATEAAALRTSLDASASCKALVGSFFREAVAEGPLLAGAGPCLVPHGIAEMACRVVPEALVLDVGSGQSTALLALALSEIAQCARRGLALTVVVRARSVARWDELGWALRSAPTLNWMIVADEALEFFSSEEGLRRWVAPCARLACFSQSRASAELVSSVFGEYDKVDLSRTQTRGAGMGIFGAGSQGSSVTRSPRRERVVRPEELYGLAEGGFFFLDSDGAVGEGMTRW